MIEFKIHISWIIRANILMRISRRMTRKWLKNWIFLINFIGIMRSHRKILHSQRVIEFVVRRDIEAFYKFIVSICWFLRVILKERRANKIVSSLIAKRTVVRVMASIELRTILIMHDSTVDIIRIIQLICHLRAGTVRIVQRSMRVMTWVTLCHAGLLSRVNG